ESEWLVERRHREDVERVEGRGLFGAGRTLDVDDPLVRVARELVEEARVKPGDTNEDEARLGMPPPDELGRVEKMDVTLVPLLASDVEDERRVIGNAVGRAEREPVVRARRVRAHAGRHDPRRVDPVLGEPT